MTIGDSHISYVSDGTTYWGQTLAQGTQTQFWTSDAHQSVIMALDTENTDPSYQAYTPYGFSPTDYFIGFNGQWRDPITGWYHLGNGERVYNPILKRFHSLDSWSPFVSGEINPYTYCLGDPINRLDPSGHFSIFGVMFSNRDLIIMSIGLGVDIAVGALTGGTGFAIETGLGIAAGVVSGVATGTIYDTASGKQPTLGSMGTDVFYGALGGVGGELVGRGLARGMRALGRTVDQLLEGAEKLRNAGGVPEGFDGRIASLNQLEARVAKLAGTGLGRTGNFSAELGGLSNQIAEIRARPEWTWHELNGSFHEQLKDLKVDQKKYYKFRDLVKEQRFSPSEAANKLGNAFFKRLQGTVDQYTIRLSVKHRVLFQINQNERIISILGVGGHTLTRRAYKDEGDQLSEQFIPSGHRPLTFFRAFTTGAPDEDRQEIGHTLRY